MNILMVTLFVSLVFMVGALVFFVSSYLRRDHEHNDRLSLLPLHHDFLKRGSGHERN